MTARRYRSGGICAAAGAVALAGCDGIQSALAPGGAEAARTALLFWVMTFGGAAILLGVAGLAAFAIVAAPARRRWLGGDRVVIVGGLIFPIVTLTALLAYGLVLTGATVRTLPGEAPLRITVVGERWWWRVIYRLDQGDTFESANELRIPIGRTVEVALQSADVIHSFWVPKLAGKLDMIPGRTNLLRLAPREAGISRGQCAEFCGGPHALMAFNVVAMPPAEFDAWLAREAGPAVDAATPAEGRRLFVANGCGGCHTIRGTAASGRIGPDLTHVGGRTSLAAGTLPNDAHSFAAWIAGNQHLKPANLMPPYGIFGKDELDALSRYLAGLR